ncbi:MAG: 6,7-dimethyl-8-ribityllumazine synthase [Steroidobacteraceae bacterium]
MSAPRILEGEIAARGRRVAIVAARFNDFIVASLLKGATAAWLERGGPAEDLLIARVPGAFELPVAARRLALSGSYDAVVALGCVIRGDTPHFEYVSGECARGLQLASLETGVPVIFGVLTVETVEQALDRAATGAGNKGGEAMEAALQMAGLMASLSS